MRRGACTQRIPTTLCALHFYLESSVTFPRGQTPPSQGYGSGALRLYRATDSTLLHWELDRVLLHRPLIDTSLVEWEGRWYMFTSDVVSDRHTRRGGAAAVPSPLLCTDHRQSTRVSQQCAVCLAAHAEEARRHKEWRARGVVRGHAPGALAPTRAQPRCGLCAA